MWALTSARSARSAGVAALALATALVACASPAPPGAPTPSASPSPSVSSTASPVTQVTLRRTGGIAGVDQRIVVTAGGAWTYTDARRGTSQQGQLTPAQWDGLVALATNPALTAEATRGSPPPGCADFFDYVLEIDGHRIPRSGCADPAGQPTVVAIISLLEGSTPL